MAASSREAPDGAHGRSGEGVAVGLLGDLEVAREARCVLLGDWRNRAGAGLGSADADLAGRHDEHRRLERVDGNQLLAYEGCVVLSVFERPRLPAGVLLARDERDLDRIAAGRGCVEDSAELELDRNVGWRRVG